MKKWTVMLIPQGRGNTQNLDLAAWHLYCVAAVLITLSFLSAFSFQRFRLEAQARQDLQQQRDLYARQLENRGTFQPQAAAAPASDDASLEARIRSEHALRDAAIIAELSELYDMERKVREITGLPPRGAHSGETATTEDGKGGPVQLDEGVSFGGEGDMAAPPHIIYGLVQPSADLMIQEINLRTDSLREWLEDVETQRDRIARTPSIWPVTNGSRRLSSSYGHRQDPLTKQRRFHSGLDIVANRGASVYSTARGKVVFADRDGDYGRLIKIDHGNGIETWYAHLDSIKVRVGDDVERGQLIGALGSSGRTTGAHLHYELRVKERTTDPRKWLGS